MKKQRMLADISFEILLLIITVISLFPFTWMALSSFKPLGEILGWPSKFFPKKWTLANYIRLFSLVPFGRYLLNSFIVAVAGSLLTVITSAMGAYSISIIKVRGESFFISLALLGLIVPVQIGFVPLFLTANYLHITDSYIGLIFPFIASPFGIFLLAQFFKLIPTDLVDAARIDGMGEVGIIRHIIMPLGKAGITTLVIFQFMLIWREFFWPLLVINVDRLRTVPLGITASFIQDEKHWGQILSASTLGILPILITFMVFQRQYVKGISWSGLKM